MGLFEHFPYTNFHDLNLDVILKRVKDAEAAAQESAEDAAASAAIAQSIESIAVDAQTKANIALPLARTAEGKTAKHSFYEIVYDYNGETVQVTDLYTNQVISTESNPMEVWELANQMFDIDLDRPPIQPADLINAAAPVTPMIKLVFAGGGQNCWISFTTITYRGLAGGFCIQFYDPYEARFANITFPTGGNFVFDNSQLTYISLPDIDSENDENKIIIVKDGVWDIGANPNPKFLVDNGELNATFNELSSLLGASTSSKGCRPWVIIKIGPNNNVAAYLTELDYDNVNSVWVAYFVGTEAGVVTVYKFTAQDQITNMTLAE